MLSSPNLGLTIWDLTGDDFDHGQLQGNWLALDVHDHSGGRGVQIGTGGILSQAITQALIAPGAVGNAQLGPLAVDTSNLQEASVTSDKVAPGAITGNLIPAGAITGLMLDPTLIPLGAIMPWWRPPGSNATPGGWWEAMDGRAWSAITNAWGLTSGTIPDTRGRFAKGADLAAAVGPAIGATGGTATANLAHTHNVLAHSHGIPNHTHTISSDGAHAHTWFGGYHMYTRQNAFEQGLTFIDYAGRQRQNFGVSTFILNTFGWIADLDADGKALTDMDSGGAHAHGGATAPGGSVTTNTATSTTDSQLGATTVDPPWAGFLYIMRCR